MTMVSGVPPYQYAIDVPLRSDRDEPIAHSGIFLEQAMFALNAERRRYKGEIENDDFEWKLYTSIMGANRGFEPTGSGLWMGDPNSPVGPLPGIVLNPILELRKNFMLHLLEDGFAEDSDYLPEQYRRDWLHNAYPNSPSGFEEVTAEDNCSGDGNYFRRAPVHPGFQLSTDIGVLGTSGVLFDIDYGEVMYNPYPRIGRTLFGDGHVLAHQAIDLFRFANNTAAYLGIGIPIPLSPAFPAFQTTSGTVVATTSRDIRPDESRYWRLTQFGNLRVQLPFNSLHVESGVFQLDGDLLRPDTKYFLGTGGNNAKEDFLPVAELPFVQSGVRVIGRPTHLNSSFGTKVPSGQNSNVARVYLGPAGSNDSPLESGMYYIAAANSGVDVPYSAVASGIVSHWPSGNHDRAAPGYHVFDDCIWVRDQSANLSASGMAIISPHDGTAMWIRFADLTNISLAGNLTFPQNMLAFSRLNFPGLIGMMRINNLIHMVYPVLSNDGIDSSVPADPPPPPIGIENVKYYVGQYDDMLNLVSTLESAVQVDTPGTTIFANPMGDIMYDGATVWICSRGGTQVTNVTTGFTYIQGYTRVSTDICRRIVLINGTYWAYGEDSGSEGNLGALQPITFAGTGGSATFSLGTPKVIDTTIMPTFEDDPTHTVVITSVHHIVHANALGEHVSDGVWALVMSVDENAMSLVVSGSSRAWLVKISEGVTTFDVEEFLQLNIPQKKAQSPLNGNPSHYDIVHMPVNPGAF